MAIAQIDPDELVQRIHDANLTEGSQSIRSHMAVSHLTPYSSQYATRVNVPKYKIPEEGAPADAVYELLRDELDHDGKPNLNLARLVVQQRTEQQQ